VSSPRGAGKPTQVACDTPRSTPAGAAPTTMSSAANLAIETFLPADAESAVAGETR
jgi:hypothetical protein